MPAPLHSHGVRQYSDYIGRFLCVDKLWDKYYSLTPYHYSGNNPVSLLDGNGKMPAIPIVVGGGYIGGAVAIGIIGWAYTEATNPGSTKGLLDAVTTSFNKGVEDVKEVINNLTENNESQAKSKGSNSESGNVGTPPPPNLDNNKNNNKGTQTNSKSLWHNKNSGARLDVENKVAGDPNRSRIQYQNGKEYYKYNVKTGRFDGMPSKLEKQLFKDESFNKALNKALNYIGQ